MSRDRPLLPLTSNQASRLARDAWVRAEGISIPPHHMGCAFRLAGPLDRAVLRQALAEVVARHEALRAAFPLVGGSTVQAIAEAAEADLELVEVGAEAGDREARAAELAAELALRPFDLRSPPLLRAGLQRLGPDDHVLVLAAEHLVADAWSLKVILEELSAIYRAQVGAGPVPACPPPPSWSRHVLNERDWLDGPGLRRELDYWRRRLAAAGPVSPPGLPMHGPTAPRRQYLARMESVRLDPELAARLKSAAASCRVTLFCALLAVLKAVLTLRTGGRDVVALSPTWNRSTEDRERLVGWAADMTAVRTDCGGDPSFRELARRVQRGVLDDMHHSRTPFEELVRRLSPELYGRFAPRGCMFFSLAPSWRHDLDLPGVRATLFPLKVDLWTLGISVDCVESDGHLIVRGSGDRGMYDSWQVLELVRDFVTLADAMARDPDRPLSRLR